MTASKLAVGTPADQLAAVAQAVLEVPFQDVCASTDVVINISTATEATFQLPFIQGLSF